MTALFSRLLNMSLSASFVVLAVVLLRLLLKKAPKALSCALWALVAFRLLCPVSLESALSLMPAGSSVSQEAISAPAQSPAISPAPAAGEAQIPPADTPFLPVPTESGESKAALEAAPEDPAINWLEATISEDALSDYERISKSSLDRRLRSGGGRPV